MSAEYSSKPAEETLALMVAGWTLSEPRRAERLLSLTGLDADSLRAGLVAGDRGILGAVVSFVRDHEADLIACADAIDVPPATIAALLRPSRSDAQ